MGDRGDTPAPLGSDVDETTTYRLLASLMHWSSVAIACSFANDILAERDGDTSHTMCGLGQRYVGWPSPMLERGRQSRIREGEGARRRFQYFGRWMCSGRAIEWELWWFRPWMRVVKAMVVRVKNAAWEMQRKMGTVSVRLGRSRRRWREVRGGGARIEVGGSRWVERSEVPLGNRRGGRRRGNRGHRASRREELEEKRTPSRRGSRVPVDGEGDVDGRREARFEDLDAVQKRKWKLGLGVGASTLHSDGSPGRCTLCECRQKAMAGGCLHCCRTVLLAICAWGHFWHFGPLDPTHSPHSSPRQAHI